MRCAFQPAKPPIVGPGVENNHARPYEQTLGNDRSEKCEECPADQRVIPAVGEEFLGRLGGHIHMWITKR